MVIRQAHPHGRRWRPWARASSDRTWQADGSFLYHDPNRSDRLHSRVSAGEDHRRSAQHVPSAEYDSDGDYVIFGRAMAW